MITYKESRMIDIELCGNTINIEEYSEFNELLTIVQQGEADYSENLGWLSPSEWANDDILDYCLEAAAKASSIADTFVLIGIGGSVNSTRALLEALEKKSGMDIIYAGNTLSAYEYEKIISKLEGHDFVIDCIAKNFETLEPGLAFRVFRDILVKRYGRNGAKERIFCTCTPSSRFESLALDEGYAVLPFPADIGGRYTALSPVHLFPMAACGADIRALSAGARYMAEKLCSMSYNNNPAFIYAALRNKFYADGYKVELLSSFEPRLRWFYKWWEQLFAESEGKDGKGLFPIAAEFSEELHSLGQFIQDGSPIMFETMLDVIDPGSSVRIPSDWIDDGFDYLSGKTIEDVNRAAQEATLIAHSNHCPCIQIHLGRIDERTIGGLFYFFEFSCYLSGRMLGINPFNQPGVEAYKKEMFYKLGK